MFMRSLIERVNQGEAVSHELGLGGKNGDKEEASKHRHLLSLSLLPGLHEVSCSAVPHFLTSWIETSKTGTQTESFLLVILLKYFPTVTLKAIWTS